MTSSTALATFGGMASGLPVQKLIDATIAADSVRLNKYTENKQKAAAQQTAYSTVKTKFSSFDTTIQKVVDSRLIYAFDLFDRKTATSSDASAATVSTDKGAMDGNVSIRVNSLAKPPQVDLNSLGGPISTSLNLSDVGIIDGDFGLSFKTPTGGVTITTAVVSGDSLASYVAKINQEIIDKKGPISGTIGVSVDGNGVAKLDFSNIQGGTLNTTDPFPSSQSNFADVLGLSADPATGNLLGTPKTSLNLDGKISDNTVGFKNFGTQTLPETINIGGLDITIDSSTTFRQVINKVNETSKCHVKMSYNTTTNSLSIKAKDEFYSDNIYFSGKALLSDLGLTDSNGVVNTSIQTKRTPGEIELNGKKIAIKSNKVTAAETGLTGVSINLLSVTAADKDPITISVSDNTSDLTTALDNMVGAFNAIQKTIAGYTYVNIDKTDTTATADTGVLSNDYTVSSMLTSLQMKLMTPSTDSSLSYKALAVIGFSVDSGTMSLDKTKFLNALSDNASDVKKLLIGSKEDGTVGVLGNVQAQLKQYTDITNGFFATKANSLTDSVTNLNKSITDEQARLDQERTRLVKQYSDLDSTVSKYQSQSSAFSS